jgi:two-component system LytT family response regulator
MLKLLVVDDEPLAHQVITYHCKAYADITIIGHCYSAAEALAVLAKQQVDLLILDIQMPVLTGLDMLKVMQNKPQVIISTAYQQYALDGFELDVADYLLKPISAERFATALQKVRRRLVLEPEKPASILLKVERELRKFKLAEVCCFEAYGNYVKVWQGPQMVLVNATLKQVYQQVASADFIQVQKSFLVNKQHVIGLDSTLIRLSNQMQIKIGPAFKDQLNGIL